MVNFKLEKHIRKQLLVAACLNLGQTLAGYIVGWSSPVIPKLQDPDKTPLPELITDTQATWVGATLYIGCIIGINFACIFIFNTFTVHLVLIQSLKSFLRDTSALYMQGPHAAGYFINSIGRKLCLIMGNVITFIGYILLTCPVNVAMIFAGRVVVGFGASVIFALNLIYIGEIASPNIRGALLTSTGVFHVFGSVMVYCVGSFMSYATVGYVILTINLLHFVGCFFIPESPVYYILKGKEEAARKTLANFRKNKEVTKDLNEMIENTKQSEAQNWQWREIFATKCNRKSFCVTVALFVFQNTSGIITIMFFSATIFKNAGSSVKPEIALIILGVTQLIGAFLAPVLIEKNGRRFLLLISSGGCCLSLIVLGIYFYLDVVNHESIQSIGWLPLVTLVIFLFSHSTGLNIVPNALLGEMYSPNIRGVGSSLSLTLGWMVGMVPTVYLGYTSHGSHIAFWTFSASNGLGFLFSFFFVPETKGKTLIEIQKLLEM